MSYERKGLDRKNRLYSIILAVILLGCLMGYFICMLPPLYVSYRMEQNLKSVEMQHKTYMETGGYGDIRLENPFGCFSVKIPEEGDSVYFTSRSWSVEIKAETEAAKSNFQWLRQFLHRYQKGDLSEDYDEEQFSEEIADWLSRWEELSVSLPFRVDVRLTDNMEYDNDSTKLHMVSEDVLIVEASVSDGENIYINYIAMEDTADALVFTYLPVVMPAMEEIRPVVLQSIPMLAAVVLLLVLLFSQLYAGGILRPVYRELEEKNLALQEENRRQEIFMRASSHQLKTPLSAALLLLDGMINQVGKYRDTAVYLPKAKEQLLSMRKMVEDILSLNHCRDNINFQQVQLLPLLERKLQEYRVAVSEKRLQVSCSGDDIVVWADEYLMQQILDNLISNAVAYTPEGGRIEMRVSPGEVSIENYGVTIPEEILPHIFDPFVSGNHEKNIAAHGLGLYIAAYYAKQLGFSVSVENRESSVLAVLSGSSQQAGLLQVRRE
ncbi:MAG: HAMP domain-containing histidine kinase [Butyrivibrio sp.]|nr:HAMP domain-containing histidine kinase [Butyrivibrio sp.]